MSTPTQLSRLRPIKRLKDMNFPSEMLEKIGEELAQSYRNWNEWEKMDDKQSNEDSRHD